MIAKNDPATAARWPMISIVDAGASREEWLDKRRAFGGMTGSVAPILQSAIGYNSIEKEYDRRVNDTEQGDPGFMAIRGQVLEPYILEKACETPIADRPLRFELLEHPRLIRHATCEWAACSPDFLAYTHDPIMCSEFSTVSGSRIVPEPLRIVGEIKSRDGSLAWKYKDGQCQQSERIQVAWNVACADADVGLLLVEIFGEIKPFVLPRDRSLEDELFESARVFLYAVESRDVGALIDLSDKASERWDLVRAAFDSDDSCIEVDDPAIDEMIDQLEAFKSSKKTAEAGIKNTSATIGRTMKQAERMITSRYRVGWSKLKTGKRGGLRIKGIE